MAKRTSKKAAATASAISVEAPISTIESATDDSVEIGTVITESGFATNEEVLATMKIADYVSDSTLVAKQSRIAPVSNLVMTIAADVPDSMKHVSLENLKVVKEYIDRKTGAGSGVSGKITASDLDDSLLASDSDVSDLFTL